MNIVTVIPARGGSKSIPKKNITLLDGVPLIKYSIDYSIKSKLVNKTIVSTDSKEIAKISKSLGAEVPFIRPENLAEDLTPDFPVFFHALKELEKIYNKTIDIMILLRPTSPIRPEGLIEKGIAILLGDKECTSVRAVTQSSQHPFRQWQFKDKYIYGFSDNNSNQSEPYNVPRQNLPETFFQTGDIEIIRRQTILDGSISGKKVLPIFIPKEKVFDIDSFDDLKKVQSHRGR